ncbi:DUF1700 domain-containing protein [Lactobacillus sp. S2-2]|uniref:DUF1700 domain-containing protein n=1 Tax=Lactobacillus sp. S2-2 TaxID=2692917 RepID=UPI001F356AEA|nr:DUF1700 domain-containing protein [Lactobacillus sp. S2-2]MCF6515324.1 DUF1700 domain-containing protein [Lactobacillus sp. S2-2]
MNSEVYINSLKKSLSKVSEDEKNDAIEFYSEYIQDAGFENISDIEKELGTPKQLARKIIADNAIKNDDIKSKKGERSGMFENTKTIWLVILAILATPVAIPVLIIILALMIGMFAALFGFIVSIICLIIVGVIFTGVIFIFGVSLIGTKSLFGLGLIGLGFAIIGLTIVIFSGLYLFISWLIQVIAQAFRNIYEKSNKSQHESED